MRLGDQTLREDPPEGRIVYVVLDDDPTGTQSVAGLPVLTSWEAEDLAWAFSQETPAFYVLTNSRSLDADSAARVNHEVVNAAIENCPPGTQLEFISRSDSTLRGHFPLETDVIAAERASAGLDAVDVLLLLPAFPEAGRTTRGGVHYVRDSVGSDIPVGESEYAQDATFGFRSSDLREWVQERTQGKTQAEEVTLISIEEIRLGQDQLVRTLSTVGGTVVADCETTEDLRLLAVAIREATGNGRTFMFRVGPPFVRAIIGQEPMPPVPDSTIEAIRAQNTEPTQPGGLVVVGSHVPATTRQLAALQQEHHVGSVEINVQLVLNDETRESHLNDVIATLVEILKHTDAVVNTSRTLVMDSSPQKSLEVATRVSAAVVQVVQGVLLTCQPRFVLAKGGITSSDVATAGLAMRRAWVHGSMLPGIVSLWSASEGAAVGIPYVVFPGNVGNDKALSEVVSRLAMVKAAGVG